MTALSRQATLALAGLAVVASLASIGLAGRLGFLVAEQRAERALLAEGQAKIDLLKTPPAPKTARPFVAGSALTQSARAGELFNVELTRLGLTIQSVDTQVRRPFNDTLDSISMRLRVRGDTASGLKALAWLGSADDAVAVEKVTAYPSDKGQAEWTIDVIVLATRGGVAS